MIFLICFFIMLCITGPQLNPIDLDTLKEMGILMGSQEGASLANDAVAKEYAKTAKSITDDQTNLNNASQSFFKNISSVTSSQSTTISDIISSAQSQITSLQKKQQEEITNVNNYMQAITSLNFPLSDYLDTKNTVLFDQLFTNSIMYTPTGTIWRNVFQIGDWMFDETTNSFWQLKDTAFLTQAANTKKDSPDDAHKNSIFTEWTTNNTYEISCSITIYKISYPFYVGIIFNKARWISGNTYGLEKYRTLGIYGDKNKKITLRFAQQQTTKPTSATSPALPISPLAQIYNDQGIQDFTLNQKAFTSITTRPITFHIKIKPSQNSVSYKIWSGGSQEPTTYTKISTATAPKSNFVTATTNPATATQPAQTAKYLAENDNDIYLYHGLGFLSPGAIAEFKLKGPQPLLFNQASIALFAKDIDDYYLSEKNKLLTKSL